MRLLAFLFCALLPASAWPGVPRKEDCARIYDIPSAIKCYGQIISSFTKATPAGERAEIYRYRALLFVNDERYQEALSDYSEAVTFASKAGGADSASAVRFTCERAVVYDRLGRSVPALADYKVCSDAGNAWALASSGEVLLRQGDARGALGLLSAAIERGQKYSYVYAKRAKAYRLSGMTRSAAADAEKAVEAAPDDVEAIMIRAKVRLDAADYSGALEDLSRLEKLTGPGGELRVYAGMANFLSGDTVAAKKSFKDAAGGHGYSAEAELDLACYWWGIKKDGEKARKILQERASGKSALPVFPALAACLKGLRWQKGGDKP